MKIDEAFKLVLEMKTKGHVIFKGELDLVQPTYTDFQHSNLETSKKVMLNRKDLYKDMRQFVIIKTGYEQAVVSISGSSVYFDESLNVGDEAELCITGNLTAEWKKYTLNDVFRQPDPSKFRDRSLEKLERLEFLRKVKTGEIDLNAPVRESNRLDKREILRTTTVEEDFFSLFSVNDLILLRDAAEKEASGYFEIDGNSEKSYNDILISLVTKIINNKFKKEPKKIDGDSESMPLI